MILYKTVEKRAAVETEVERSRFIGHIAPVNSREEAEAFIDAIRKEYKDATHNVPAMVLGEAQQIQWGSDDGEPQGTSGAPMVQMFVQKGLTNLVIVVTRYFGGTKLGTGGLIRAYTGCAEKALEEAGIHEVKSLYEMIVSLDYKLLAKLQNLEKQGDFCIENIEYTDVVTCTLTCDEEKQESLKTLISDLSGGQADVKNEALKNA